MRVRTVAAVITGLVVTSPAFALSVSGSVDPAVGLQSLLTYVMPLAGIVIVTICAAKGVHAAAEGRHIGPYIGGAIGGTALAFGGAALLTHYGVS